MHIRAETMIPAVGCRFPSSRGHYQMPRAIIQPTKCGITPPGFARSCKKPGMKQQVRGLPLTIMGICL